MTFADSLWLGNDRSGFVFRTTLRGAILKVLFARVTGVAFDGNALYFSDTDGTITKRTADGATIVSSFRIVPALNIAEDMAWDSTRQRLWRIDHGSVIERIDPVTQTRDQVVTLPTADPVIQPRGGLGIAYDSNRDLLYVSFCKSGCATLQKGLVIAVNPDSGAVAGELFRTEGFATGGLAYDSATDSLWVGDVSVVRNMTLSGSVISSFSRPQPGGFVDGLEFVSGADLPPSWPAGSTLNASNVGLTSMTLTWTAAQDDFGVTSYQLYQNGVLRATLSAFSRSFLASGLAPCTNYLFKIEACDASGQCSFDGPSVSVTTLTPSQSLLALIQAVDDLVNSGALSEGAGRALKATLEAAMRQLDRGNIEAMIQQLNAFEHQVEAFVNSGALSAADGQRLIGSANELIANPTC